METFNNFYVLYPVYFDANKKISEGRKYHKNLCVSSPTFLEITNALKYLEIDCTAEIDKRHPRDYFRSGRFKINKMYGKKNLIEGLRDTIIKSRIKNSSVKPVQRMSTEKVPEFITTKKGEIIENKLNLVARKKNKQKKSKKNK
ncbi:hypothetical protein NCER_100726 [Vairimorpha ceranae BRL01]|uniref:Uncharacterized protein n=2 Tax=Vairimorpha ceranae TaxID=40302 RepID=C4V8B4_VAIC1|nr:signal recognition particle protein srp19 [Vairimorpha ceranae]EEQ82549.1 hypothetical protein NCER_100726 [Vairimorpha ceranae BRL01]KAF5141279.1 hypothetical protein G9O61_00g005960 [Vairimorpha ceranae]KKO76511.1 signal recognition particle protein srp19 [Vairimorpha ceranae]